MAFLAVLYGVVLFTIGSRVMYAAAPFAAGAIVMGAWLYGMRGSILTLLCMACEGLTINRLMEPGSWMNVLNRYPVGGLVSIVVISVVVGRMSDLDRKVKLFAHELQHQAFHDPLTGLPNRALFADRLEHATARVSRGTSGLAVLFVDLDGFKRINDRHGHAVGDLLLRAVSKRLQTSLRVGDTVARLGGDEFVVLLEDIDAVDVARQSADRLVATLDHPFIINDDLYKISASIGVVFCPAGFTRSADLVREADRAMYQAKATGAGHYQIAESLVA
jgi:diguanylate cyclase (GGDEF)-like protein